MDWSLLFEDNGDTADYAEIDALLASHVGRLAALRGASAGGYGPRTMYAFTVNYILGVGTLGIPFAFQKAGLLISIVLMAAVGLLTTMTVNFVVECCIRASKLPREETTGVRKSPTATKRKASPSFSTDAGQKERIPELTQCCGTYLSTPMQISFQVCLSGLMYAGLTAYTQVFVHSVRSQFSWAEDMSSGAIELIFSAIVLPLSCAELTEQVGVQVAMAGLNFLLLILMMSSSLLAALVEGTVGRGLTAEVTRSDPAYAGLIFSTAVFGQLFQHSVPGLMRPLSADQQRYAPSVFRTAIWTTAIFYMALGAFVSAYFGDAVLPSCNLNWERFAWPWVGEGTSAVLSSAVILFPALNTLTVFPLIAITLGNNLACYFPHLKRLPVGANPLLARTTRKRLHTMTWRLVAALPPIGLSLLISDLSMTMQLAGLCGIVVAYVVPAVLQLRSRERALAEQGTADVRYSWVLSGERSAQTVLAFALLAIGVVTAQIITKLAGASRGAV